MRPRLPSPAMVIACIALFAALGGTAYAATQLTGSNARHGTSHRKASSKAIAAAVAKYVKAHRKELLGPRGPAGEKGDPGPASSKGDPGARGEQGLIGPTGLASASATLAGPVSTGSSSSVDLGGPSVTVKVGPSGLVAYWITATLKSVGGGTAQVILSTPSGSAPQIQSNSSSPIKFYSEPGSNNGMIIFNGGLSTVYVGPGTKTISLRYADTAGTGTFEDVELVVLPL